MRRRCDRCGGCGHASLRRAEFPASGTGSGSAARDGGVCDCRAQYCKRRDKDSGEVDAVYSDSGVDAMSQEEYRKAAVAAVRKLSEDVGIPSKLEAIKESDLDFLAESAHADACAPGNPKDASVEDLKELFRKIM